MARIPGASGSLRSIPPSSSAPAEATRPPAAQTPSASIRPPLLDATPATTTDEVPQLAARPLPPPFATPVHLPDETVPADILEGAEETLRNNWRGTYTAPSTRRPSDGSDPLDPATGFTPGDAKMKYPWQWLWDSGFHATVLTDLGQFSYAKTELSSLLARQRPDGFIPDMSGKLLDVFPAQITQPPVLGEAALHLFDSSGSLPKGTYERLVKYHAWLASHTDPRTGLYAVRSGLESGDDTSPVYDSSQWGNKKGNWFEKALYQVSRVVHDLYGVFAPSVLPRPDIHVQPVLFNSIYARDLEAMRDLALKTGHPQDAQTFAQRYDQVKASMRANMRDPQQPFLFWSLDKHDQPIKTKTSELFMPLYAGLLTPEEAKQLVAYLEDPKNGFATKYPIPSTATTEKAFDPNDYWRGPTWVNTNFMVMEGLLRYGYHDEAQSLYEKTVAMIRQNDGPMRFDEGYNPSTGKAVRQGQFGWSTLVVSMARSLNAYEQANGLPLTKMA